MKHHPRKRFGQNFLHDPLVIEHIISVIAPSSEQHLVEIGPGLAALTRPLLQITGNLDVIEIDRDLIAKLKNAFQDAGTLNIHEADALKFDFSSLIQDTEKLRIVGNLPYNISTPLLFHLLEYSHIIEDMHFMLQKEVVQRLAATPGNHSYGRLSVIMQYYCQVSDLFEVPPSAFSPAPKVDSAIVRLRPYPELPVKADDIKQLQLVVRTAFNQRRKTLRKALQQLISASDLEGLEIDPTLRAEKLSVKDYVKISNFLGDYGTIRQ